MYVAEQRHDARLVKGERTLFALRPGSQIVSGLLVGANRGPEDVVGHVVAIQEVDRCTLLHHHDVRREHQSFLVDHRMLFGSGESFPRNRIDVDHRMALHAGDFALDITRPSRAAQRNCDYCQNRAFLLFINVSFVVVTRSAEIPHQKRNLMSRYTVLLALALRPAPS